LIPSSFQTIFSPESANDYKNYGQRKRWDNNDKKGPGGGDGGGPRGPRISGMQNLPGEYHATAVAVSDVEGMFSSKAFHIGVPQA
jgi:Selenoprotein SelK_SelG